MVTSVLGSSRAFSYGSGFGYTEETEDGTINLYLREIEDIMEDGDPIDITPENDDEEWSVSFVEPIFDVGAYISFSGAGKTLVMLVLFEDSTVEEYGPWSIRTSRRVDTADGYARIIRGNTNTNFFFVLQVMDDGSYEVSDFNVTDVPAIEEGPNDSLLAFLFTLSGNWVGFPIVNGTTLSLAFYDFVNDEYRFSTNLSSSFVVEDISMATDGTKVYLAGDNFKVYWINTETWEEGEYDPAVRFVNYYPDRGIDIFWQQANGGGFLVMQTYDSDFERHWYALSADGSSWDSFFIPAIQNGNPGFVCQDGSSFCFANSGSAFYVIESLGRSQSPRSSELGISFLSINGILNSTTVVVSGDGEIHVVTIPIVGDDVTSISLLENEDPSYSPIAISREEGAVFFPNETETGVDYFVWALDGRFADVGDDDDAADDDDASSDDDDFATALYLTPILALAYLL